MRLVQYTEHTTGRDAADAAGASRVGVLTDEETVVDLQRAASELDTDLPATTVGLLETPSWRAAAERAVAAADGGSGAVQDRDGVSLDAPVRRPGKVVCVGLNYREHAAESDAETPDTPVLFAKFPTSITGPGSPIRWDPGLTEKVDFETELAVVVGERARRVDRETAKECVAGYTVANDVSARDLQFADEQWVRGKSLDTFCPLGPSLVTPDELDDPHDLAIWTDVNGDRLQESSTDLMVFDVYDLLAFCSEAFTLEPGDVLLTGTPPGVGAFREPSVYLDDGDEVTVGVEGVGELTNPCEHE